MKRFFLTFILSLCSTLLVTSTQAAVKYWDIDGVTAGAGGATPAGTWDGATSNWTTDAAGGIAGTTWATNDIAVFSAGSDASGEFIVTVSGTQVSTSITNEEGTVILAGGAVALGTGAITLHPGATLSTDSSLRISAVSNQTGRATITMTGATLRTTNPGAAGTFYDQDFGITINGACTFTHVTPNILNILQTATTVTGPGSVTKMGQGVLAIAGTCTYSGSTTIAEGELRIRTSANRLPTATDVTVTSPGILNLNGVSQQIGSLTGDGAVGLAGATLTIGGSASPPAFTGAIITTANAGAGGSTATGGNVTKSGTGTLTLSGANAFTGLLTLSAGGITVTPGGALCDPICDVSVNGGTLTLNNAAQEVENLLGNGGIINLGAGHVLTVNPANAARSSTYFGTITGSGGLTKIGASNTETLAGPNTYTGPTTVSAGKLVTTTASTGAGSYTVASDATLGARRASVGAALNISDLTFEGPSTNEFDLGDLGFSSSPIVSNAVAITVNGTVSVNAKGFNGNGTATLLQYGGARNGTGSFVNGTFPPHMTASITDDTANSRVILNVADADTLVWVSDVNGIWNVNNAANEIWKLATAGTPTFYQETVQGDTVRFDDTATGTTTLSIPATVAPFKITVDNSSQNYTFGGVGKISGTTSLTKSGTGQLTILTTNDFIGGTTLNAGAIALGNNSTLGTGKLTIIGGAIRSESTTARTLSAPVDLNGDVTFGDAVNTGTLVFSTGAWNVLGGTRQITVDTSTATISSIIGGGGLTKAGSGTLNLTGANTFTDAVTVNAGVLAVTVATALGTTAGNTVVASGAALQTSTTAAIAENLILNGTGIGNAGALRHTGNNKTLSGAITLGSSGVRINCDANTLTLTGGISGPGNPDLFMGGAGGITVNTTPINIGTGTFTWDTSLVTLRLDTANTMGAFNYNSGIVKFNTDTAAGQGTITVGPAATEFSVTGGFFPVLANNVVLTSGANPQFYAASGGLLTLNGIISGPGAAQRRDTGAVNPVLNGANTFEGGFLVSSRGVMLGNKSALGVGTFSIGEVATTPQTAISIAANKDLAGINALTNPVAITQNFTLSGTNGLEFSGPVTLGNLTPTITVSSSAATILSGVISGSGFGLTKAGAGTLTLAGANSYDGATTISNGVLRVSNTGGSGTGSGAVTVTAGTLTGEGSISGTVALSGGLAPGSSVGTLTTGSEIWNGGGLYSWELINASGAAGTGWDLLTVNGGIDIQATSGSRFTIKVLSLDGSGAVGSITNFDNNSSYTWPIATTTDAVTNYAADGFAVDFGSVSNDLAGGEFFMDASSLAVRFTNNHPPIASTALYFRPQDTTLQINISDLLAASTSDPDGDARELVSVSGSSTNGLNNVTNDATFLYYTPGTNGNVTDAFSYTVRDVRAAYRAGDSIRQASGNIIISITPDSTNQTHNIVSISTNLDGNVTINFAGVPGRDYLVQGATNLAPPVFWQTLSTNVAGTNGLWSFSDLEATNYTQRYYRSARP